MDQNLNPNLLNILALQLSIKKTYISPTNLSLTEK